MSCVVVSDCGGEWWTGGSVRRENVMRKYEKRFYNQTPNIRYRFVESNHSSLIPNSKPIS